MLRIHVLLLLFCFTGCAALDDQHKRTVLINHQTGETGACSRGPLPTASSSTSYENCIQSLQKQGYTIWSQY